MAYAGAAMDDRWSSRLAPSQKVPMSAEAALAAVAAVAGPKARSREATQAGAQAFARLLALAEQRESGQVARVARFLAATYNGLAFPLDPSELRAADGALSEDMLRCLDALRWGRADLHTLVPDGDARMRAVIEGWGLRPSAQA